MTTKSALQMVVKVILYIDEKDSQKMKIQKRINFMR